MAGGNGNNNSVTSQGTGSSSLALSAPGGVAKTTGALTAVDTCTGNRRESCTGTATVGSASTDAALAATALDPYVGGGTVTVSRSATSLSAEQQSNAFAGAESTTSTVGWAGTLSIEYAYLLHAAASFAGDGLAQSLDLDFGNVALGSAATLGFGLFNLAGDRVGLDLDGFSGTGDTARLTTDLALFTALAAGGSSAFTATLDTATAGLFEATYTLLLSDADVGAEASRYGGYTLTLNLRGNVLAATQGGNDDPATDPGNNVPEPASLALLAAGLAGLGATRRRRTG